MQVPSRASHPHFEICQAPQGEEEGGHPGSEHCRIRNQDRIGAQSIPVGLEEWEQVRRSDLLLPLDQNDHVHRQAPALRKEKLERLQVEEDLTLVVGSSPGMNSPGAKRGLEWRGSPQVERLSRLHVVVPIHQQGGGIWTGPPPLDQGNGVACGFQQLGVEASPSQGIHHPGGGLPGVGRVGGTGADRRNPEEFEQFVEEPLEVLGNLGSLRTGRTERVGKVGLRIHVRPESESPSDRPR